MARPPAVLPDGEFWARITVHARDDGTPALVDTSDSATSRVRIAMETATVLPAFFRKGAVSTGVIISDADAVTRDDAIDVSATLTRTGNGAFIGIAHIIVHDSAGHTVASTDRQLAVYRSMRPRWTLALPPDACSNGCSVAIRLATDRHDVPRSLLLHADPAETVVAARRESVP
jgi:hypothetical protein